MEWFSRTTSIASSRGCRGMGRPPSRGLTFLFLPCDLALGMRPAPQKVDRDRSLAMLLAILRASSLLHQAGRHSPPLPRPRPAAEPAPMPVASNKEWSEFVPHPVASKKKTPTPIQIND